MNGLYGKLGQTLFASSIYIPASALPEYILDYENDEEEGEIAPNPNKKDTK